ncbi:MAG: cobalt-precorrin-5B (C(1))-methyltransferase CbiD [Eubacterium sp.]|jgi:cobalt-precorrin-5B (C1)-methyltransferase|nr:cobalt-precorrin-5B (C(1))-methyltransferase CbiD [Eubacterium sp.]MCH4046289.1 cobalt-precorrin-5B (C(1))-methyltransferase CbiD [Eubacterium sp.]MCH4079384.1 cobalt-precorrin-5B (C(1))-methyltransferase CbiD [Eubacterium sp.]MCI1307465.1 cobalt-precorrin-5B (C(1))-methyltransferase CbiD [Eubacterium sp.]MCI1405983.1 cobalt-precorrin-5B (C(1))-methyltransferase CbiD [Eubacterium sp.]
MDEVVRNGNKMLRLGFTTGTCAALASSGALHLLLTGRVPEKLKIVTRKGIPVSVAPEEAGFRDERKSTAYCLIKKDAGDDIDATDGALIGAEVTLTESAGITIDGGEGVGRVTKAGLDQPVGAAAINSVPRQMIRESLEACARQLDYPLGERGAAAVIFVPEGREIAEKTFNPHLGITGGISILGTTGIVEPMSEQALVDTIEVEMKQKRTESEDIILVPGNYGENFLQQGHLGKVLDHAPLVQCSNFIGDAVDIAGNCGFHRVLLTGHIGKLVKLAGGMMNTHSRMGDCRMEILTAHAACAGADKKTCQQLMQCAVTDEAVRILEEAGVFDEVLQIMLQKIQQHLNRRAEDSLEIGAAVYQGERLLGLTETAEKILKEWEVQIPEK